MINISIVSWLTGIMFSSQLLSQSGNIQNDKFWNTKDGKPLNSQGWGIFRFADPVTGKLKYYWYGVHYQGADLYRENLAVTIKNAVFESVTCYSSDNLVDWIFEKDVLPKEEVIKSDGRVGWVGRLGVAYVKEMNVYAMFVQHGNGVLIALSRSPIGPFSFHQQLDMTSTIGTPNTGDQTVFTDEDSGKSYLVYSYGRGRNKIYISEIGVKDGKINLLDCTKIFQGAGREGNCMFKYKGKYYSCASDLYGWDASNVYYLVADSIRGPYTPLNNMQIMDGSAEDYGHVTQTGFFVTVKGSREETVIYCGDRWADFAGNGLGYNQWLPLSFVGAKPHFNSLNSWNLDERSGEWQVNTDNNWVKNGSFEADRKIVIGERSLNLSDQIDFSRKVSQTIISTPFVKLSDGTYTLSAIVRNSNNFKQLVMYAGNGKAAKIYSIQNEHSSWVKIQIEHVPVKGGSIEIGFLAEGKAGAFCYIDDVTFIKD